MGLKNYSVMRCFRSSTGLYITLYMLLLYIKLSKYNCCIVFKLSEYNWSCIEL